MQLDACLVGTWKFDPNSLTALIEKNLALSHTDAQISNVGSPQAP